MTNNDGPGSERNLREVERAQKGTFLPDIHTKGAGGEDNLVLPDQNSSAMREDSLAPFDANNGIEEDKENELATPDKMNDKFRTNNP